MIRTAAAAFARRQRKLAHRTLVRSCSPVIESLEARQLLSATSSIDLISVASDGSASAAASGAPSVSADGNLVVFTSTAALVPGVTANGQEMVYLRNLADNSTTLISKASDGSRPDAPALEPKISGDGKFVVYSSAATNLVAGDTNGHADIFLYDIAGDSTTLISPGSGGTAADGDSSAPSISSDGHLIVFSSDATNLIANDLNNASDVFLFDTTDNSVTRVSTRADGAEATAGSFDGVIAADGGFVAFLSGATNLVTADTNAVTDVFLKDLNSGAVTRLSVSTAGAEANGASGRIAISADGKIVAFESDATNLVIGDTNAFTDIFLRDVTNNLTTRASVGPSIAQATGGTSTNPSISADGRYVAFASAATNLISGDTNGTTDVFVYDRFTQSTRRVSTGRNDLQGTGGSSDSPAISGNGQFIAFRSDANNLVTGDANGVADVFLKDRLAVPAATVYGTPDGTSPVAITSGNGTQDVANGTDYGPVDVNSATVTRTYTITNTGTDVLTLNGSYVTITGANAADFTLVASDAVTSLEPGESAHFTVRFDPSALGVRTATIRVNSNDSSHPTYTVNVAGAAIDTTVASRMVVTQGTTAVPTGGATPFSFGIVGLNTDTKSLVFTVMNVSAQSITLDPVALAQATGFTVSVNLNSEDPGQTVTIAPGHTATFTLDMSTATLGDTSATVTLSNSVSGGDPRSATFAVAGSVQILPQLEVLVDGTDVTNGQALDYGSAVHGSASPSKVFKIQNNGTADLTISVPTLPAGYTLVGTVPTTIAPGQNITFTIQLDTSAAPGTMNGTFSFTTNDANSPTFTLTFSGSVGSVTGPSATFLVDGASVAGRSISLGTVRQRRAPVTQTVTLRNDGTENLVLGKITLPAGYLVWSGPGASTLAPGESTTFTVSYKPLAAGTQTGILSVATNESTGAVTSGITVTVNRTARNGLTVDSVAVNDLRKAVIVGGTGVAATAAVALFNHSSAAISGTYHVTLYAAAGPFARPGADRVLGSATLRLNLSAYGKATRAIRITFPSPRADKRYGIFAVVTGAHVDPVHNFARAPFSVRIEKPIAKVGRGAAGLSSLTAARGTRVTQLVPISNTGNVPITGSLTAQVWLSTHGGALTGATRVATLDDLRISLAPKAPGKLAVSFTLPKTLPDTLTTGVPYNLIVKIKKVHSDAANTLRNQGIIRAGTITIK